MTAWIDLDRTAQAPRRQLSMMAVVAALAGIVGGLTATVAQAQLPDAPVTREVRFQESGDGKVEYAALVSASGIEQVASVVPHQVQVGTTVVLTVRSVAPSWCTTCRILADGVTVNEKPAGGGNSVTCIWTVTR